jgi:hypothetical protein
MVAVEVQSEVESVDHTAGCSWRMYVRDLDRNREIASFAPWIQPESGPAKESRSAPAISLDLSNEAIAWISRKGGCGRGSSYEGSYQVAAARLAGQPSLIAEAPDVELTGFDLYADRFPAGLVPGLAWAEGGKEMFAFIPGPGAQPTAPAPD